MHWPRVIKAKGSHQGDSLKQAGRLTNQVGHIVDISATLREITGADYPKEILGWKTKNPLDYLCCQSLRGSNGQNTRKFTGDSIEPMQFGKVT